MQKYINDWLANYVISDKDIDAPLKQRINKVLYSANIMIEEDELDSKAELILAPMVSYDCLSNPYDCVTEISIKFPDLGNS